MSFSDAIRSGFDNYANFKDRASRSAYWWWFLFALLVAVATNIIDLALGTYPWVGILATLGLFLPNLSVGVRRLHDTNRTGGWILISLIPLIGFIVLLIFFVQQGDADTNDYGAPPAESAGLATI